MTIIGGIRISLGGMPLKSHEQSNPFPVAQMVLSKRQSITRDSARSQTPLWSLGYSPTPPKQGMAKRAWVCKLIDAVEQNDTVMNLLMSGWLRRSVLALLSWGVWAIMVILIGEALSGAHNQALSTLGILPIMHAKKIHFTIVVKRGSA